MSKRSVFCIATNRNQADEIVDRLKIANFSPTDISVLFPDNDTTRDFAHEKSARTPEGIATGSVVGGTLGWLAGIEVLTIPGAGPFIAAGPVRAALSAAGGGITGGLIDLGIPELDARGYEDKVKEGNILLSLQGDNSDEIKAAERIFKSAGAQDLCIAGEPAATRRESNLPLAVGA